MKLKYTAKGRADRRYKTTRVHNETVSYLLKVTVVSLLFGYAVFLLTLKTVERIYIRLYNVEPIVVVVSHEVREPIELIERGYSIEDKICAYDWDCELMIAVAKAESRLDPNAINYNTNGTVDRGIFQVNSIWGDWSTFDVDENIANAYEIYKIQGISAWSAYNNGAYLAYLN
jgi:hypothetical protein